MKLVVDANIIFAALLRDSKTREILLYPFFEFYVPEFIAEEIQKVFPTLKEEAGATEENLDELAILFLNKVNVIPKDAYMHKYREAAELMGHIDKKDVPYLALALSIQNDGIWSNDNHFSKQTKVKHWHTADILEMFKK